MRIACGATRLVVLTENYAIKVAYINIFRIPYGFIKSLVRKLLSKEPLRFSRTGVHLTRLRRQVAVRGSRGLRANLAEAKYWSETRDPLCAPVLKVWLGGRIIVQPRGRNVTKSEVVRSIHRYRMLADPEFREAKQFARFRNGVEWKIKIIDYASLGDPSLGCQPGDQLA